MTLSALGLSVMGLAAPGFDAPVAAESPAPAVMAYQWNLPRGFPLPAVPTDNAMAAPKIELGRRLFRDRALSGSGTVACSDCHRPELAYTDGRSRSIGASGESTRRSAMTLTNVAYNATFTWADKRVTSLEAQMRQPLFSERPIEMGVSGHEQEVLRRLRSDPQYAPLFAAAFAHQSQPITLGNAIKSIAAFERTLISGRSAFDRYVFDDQQDALSPAAKRGMGLFFSPRLACAECHSGINFSGPVRYRGHENVVAAFVNTGLYSVDGHGSYPADDTGLREVTHRNADMGKIRVPTLRNVALTAPYMHDGSIATLAEVVDHYARGGRQSPGGSRAGNTLVDRRISGFQITAEEKSDLIAFLQSLTDPPR
jgi:cytochrome c peroxidase